MTEKKQLKHNILVFLCTNKNIAKLDFIFRFNRIKPVDYSQRLYRAIQRDDIIIRTKGAAGPQAGASYDVGYDSFELKPNFSITNWRDQGFFIHESTHAVIDLKKIGKHSAFQDEAVAYFAEALFLEALGMSPLSSHHIRKISHEIAKDFLKGKTAAVPLKKIKELEKEVKKVPMYRNGRREYNSNGFDRPWYKTLLRYL